MQDDFEQLAIALRPKLISLCRSFFQRQDLACDAEDAVQETLLRLWLMRNRLRDYLSPEALAIMMAKNVCIDILKRADTHHDTLEKTLSIPALQQTDQQAITNDTGQWVARAMEKLTDTQRRMLVMRGEGMSMEEIGAACGTTASSAKTMICTARKRMMDLLKIRRNEI